jgi:predicted ATPase
MRGTSPKASPPARFTTSFVGREALLSAVEEALAEHGLVTLIGPPGAGKSRLAAEVCGRSAARVAWCSVEGVASIHDVAARLADAAGARLLGERGATTDALGAALRKGVDRVVLDGAETAQPELAPFLVELLGAAPAVRVLVTSRARVGAPGEALVEVPPLDLSPSGEAEQLFLQRARLVRPDLQLDAAGREQLQALVRSLDGLPLAIEFAAARSRFVPLAQLVERVLSPSRAGDDLPLWTALERSLSDLPAETQSVFAQLGVFRGGFSLEAAEAVVESPTPVLGALSELSDRSLLSTVHAAGSVRFVMLNAVRAAAERRLSADERAALRARHLACFAALADRCTAEDAADPAALRRDLASERDNLAAAMEGGRDAGASEKLVLANAWAAIHQGIGPLSVLYAQLEEALSRSSGHAQLEEALSRSPGHARLEEALSRSSEAPVALRARAVATLAGIARELDRCADVLAAVEAVAAEAERAGDAGALAVAQAALGETLTALGRFDEGARALEAARKLERTLRRPLREARALHALGVNRVEAGRLGEARLALRESQAALDGRDPAQEACTLAILGVIEIEEGRLSEARACLERALPIAEESHDLRLVALTTTNHAVVSHESGDLDAAAAEYERAAELCRAAGMRRGEALARFFAGNCHLERGQFGAARAAYEEALARLTKEGWRHLMVLVPYAAAAAMDGDVELARRTLDEADASLRAIGQERLALAVHVCRGFLDLAEADRLRARGDEAGAAARVEAARQRTLSTLVDPTPRPSASGGPALAQQSTDLRVALRALRRAVEERQSADKGSAPAPAPASSWEVAPDGSVVISPSGARSDLTRRAALRRIVARLASERVGQAGGVVGVEELVRAGWPGEEIEKKAGEARVYAAIATLRKLGLAGLLQSTGDGYRLDPSVPLRVSG